MLWEIKMRRLKNKKSNVPIILFVIGVFAVCSFGLLTFLISDFKVSNSFVGINYLETLNLELDEYEFYLNQGISEEEALTYFNVREDEFGKYFYYEKIGQKFVPNFGFSWVEEELLFSLKHYAG